MEANLTPERIGAGARAMTRAQTPAGVIHAVAGQEPERALLAASAARRGYDARWRRVRAMVLAREPRCRDCAAAGRVTLATEVHHLDGNPRNNAPDNLVPLCKPCHSRRTLRDIRDGKSGL